MSKELDADLPLGNWSEFIQMGISVQFTDSDIKGSLYYLSI